MQEKKFFTITQAADFLKVSVDTLRRLEKKGAIKPNRGTGNTRQYSFDDLVLLQQTTSNQKRTYSISETSKILQVSIDTIRRWEKAGKIQSIRTPGGHRRFTHKEVDKVKTTNFTPPQPKTPPPTPMVPDIASPMPLPQPTPSSETPQVTPSETTEVSSSDPNTPKAQKDHPKTHFTRSKPFIYATIFTILLLLIGGGLILNRTLNPTSADDRSQASYNSDLPTSPSNQISPKLDTSSFLNGKITIGTNDGSVASLDEDGNFNITGDIDADHITANSATIRNDIEVGGGLLLLPHSQPTTAAPGTVYYDKTADAVSYYNGTEWIYLDQTSSEVIVGSLQDAYDVGNTITATSGLAIKNSDSSTIFSIPTSSSSPILLGQNTSISGDIYANKFIDTQNNSYYIDPDESSTAINVAGNIALKENITFSQNGEVLSNGDDGYIT
ncbi:MerR family DNA-binding transcriptional regulator, partial [Patescibacteria group bacterium]